jgi:hypothetical protein
MRFVPVSLDPSSEWRHMTTEGTLWAWMKTTFAKAHGCLHSPLEGGGIMRMGLKETGGPGSGLLLMINLEIAGIKIDSEWVYY